MSTGCIGKLQPRTLGLLISFILAGNAAGSFAADIEFNTDVLDVSDRINIDLGQFSRGNFIMPGDYLFTVHINKQTLTDQLVTFYPPDNDDKSSEACITPQLVEQLGLKESALLKLTWWHQNQCLVISSLEGMEVRGDLGAAALYLNIPQAYLEYTAENWDPPSRWDEGIPGLLLDYNLNGQGQRQQKQSTQSYNLSGNGTLGGNIGAWRLRADWQSHLDHQSGSGEPTQTNWEWSRYYVYRALPKLGAKLTMGEDFLNSDIFDSFRFAGASLVSDDNMLPPNLRGYAPEVVGIARSNAKVIISQQGRVLYETQVASGPFRIQDINDAVSGLLDVRVEEQDGSVQEFRMDTASIPYLTRPGSVRYKVMAGRPTDWQRHSNGPIFGSGEFSWGVSNGWSLYGGGVAGGEYNALALGVGRDLMMFGALSFDATQSRARLQQQGTLSGGSYRLSYSKRFDDYDSQVTFAGYRFSERNYMSMSEYLDARTYGTRNSNSKEMYTITFNQQLRDLGMSAYLNYNHQTYWDRPANDRYNLTLSRYFDLGRFRNISLSLTAYRNKFNGNNDDGMYMSLSLPWGKNGSLSYSSSYNRNDNTHQVGYYDRLNERDTYQLSAGSARNGAIASGYYSHRGDLSQLSANVNYQAGQYSSVGLSMQGGATATPKGAALHRNNVIGGTRMLLDTDGVAGIPISGYDAPTVSNAFGKAVVVDVGSYYRNQFSIDLNALPENAEVNQSVVQATLTEGAIGYRRFEVIAGEKAMAVVRLSNGSAPPFGATVHNGKRQEVGIVNDNGEVYLSGINVGEVMSVNWGGVDQCGFTLPLVLPPSQTTNLLLPCGPLASGKT
ncbi:fimbrial assembly protein [Serratia fonticola]|uniref:outer membrane usher protein n=1 Tax=Serratia fonticola TaxID=47917 RepID=UPI00040CF62E|nr:outer membrane usher protein [Serratia fonticola]AKG68834.1 fimbrial assembly protein [Serratia fonticola]CAI1907804.1 Outer membrane usher protein papC precursor [Serratia fonticola]